MKDTEMVLEKLVEVEHKDVSISLKCINRQMARNKVSFKDLKR